ncbi:MAG: S8 family serine peptidase, partial [Sedimentisphaerales bacterium]|nr:S8 family serine peptidase [Sedimentisphaerales bacterium]
IGQWESRRPDGTHADLIGRVLNVADGGAIGEHATQVAGTMIGDGSLLENRTYRGVAPGAVLASFPAWEDTAELRRQYRQAIELYGIDIANNSWGKVEWHVYKDYAAAMDDIVRGSLGKRLPIVWAAGNEGRWGTILCTAVAKNVVTVGATNSDDHSLWAWSNKGPTEDGRIKPELVAPGCETGNGGIWSTLPDNRYGYPVGGGCGTSLAAPSVTGTMALILEDWRALHGGDPLPSTLKGLLIHTALDLGNPGPDYAHGYGLIDARRAIDLVRADTIDEVIVEDMILDQGQRHLYTIELPPDEKELKITLVWDDYPADPLAAHALVNDLDLVVTGPDGRRHYPWTLDPYLPEGPAVRMQADRTNNVEQVVIENPRKGTWQITVWGATVPQRDQTYSLLTSRAGLASTLPGETLISVVGRLGGVVAEFDDMGNLILQGGLIGETEDTPPAGAFLLWAPDRTTVGYIDLAGNLSIQGRLAELAHCTPISGGFCLKDAFGDAVACIDPAGNLCLAGRLYHNP